MGAALKSNMVDYYGQRASEYEVIYHRPERQSDLRCLEREVTTAFSGEKVFEVACGTGYWTQFISQGAQYILAVDYNAQVIAIARQK